MRRLDFGDFGTVARRWLKFNFVGGMGIVVQLAALIVLRTGLQFSVMSATALAVEVAVVHNFLWHERFTWADRRNVSRQQSLARFLRFNSTAGLVSIAGNLVLMKAFIDVLHTNYAIANLMAIATCSIVNFAISDRLVFGPDGPRSTQSW